MMHTYLHKHTHTYKHNTRLVTKWVSIIHDAYLPTHAHTHIQTQHTFGDKVGEHHT